MCHTWCTRGIRRPASERPRLLFTRPAAVLQTIVWHRRGGWMARATCGRAPTSCSAPRRRATWWRKVGGCSGLGGGVMDGRNGCNSAWTSRHSCRTAWFITRLAWPAHAMPHDHAFASVLHLPAAITPGRLKERKTSRICVNQSPLVTGEPIGQQVVAHHGMLARKGMHPCTPMTCLFTRPLTPPAAPAPWGPCCVQPLCSTCSWGLSRWMSMASKMWGTAWCGPPMASGARAAGLSWVCTDPGMLCTLNLLTLLQAACWIFLELACRIWSC